MNPDNTRKWLALFGTTLLLAGLSGLVAPRLVSAEVCPPEDPIPCLIRCTAHKRRCLAGCRARKRQCLAEVRAETQACKLECRLDDAVDDVGACKRRCTARGLAKAREVCRLGRPDCVRLCHPEGCRERCGLVDGEQPDADVSGSGQIGDLPLPDAQPSGATCEPPVDRECLAGCARDLHACATAVYEYGQACLAECRDLSGWERLRCLNTCSSEVIAGGQRCKLAFSDCVEDCGLVVSEGEDPVRVPGTGD